MAKRAHKGQLDRSSQLESILRRAQPVHMAVIYGLIAVGLGIWFAIDRYNAATVVSILLLVAISAIAFELGREIITLREDISKDTPVELCWDEADTVTALRSADDRARADSHVRCVWGALTFSPDFQDFVTDQLGRSMKKKYVVERWVDITKVDCGVLEDHLKDAFAAMKDGRYVLHLVPETSFGAMVVDNKAAVVNFQAHRDMRGVIGLYGEDGMLTGRVSTMINELDRGLVLPGTRRRTQTVEQLQEQARKYYDDYEG